MDNAKMYSLLVDSTKARFNATGRAWDNLSDTEKGEQINAQRAGFNVIADFYQASGFGQRTRYMRAMVEATDVPTGEAAVSRARQILASIGAGNSPGVSPDEANKLAQALDTVELAD